MPNLRAWVEHPVKSSGGAGFHVEISVAQKQTFEKRAKPSKIKLTEDNTIVLRLLDRSPYDENKVLFRELPSNS